MQINPKDSLNMSELSSFWDNDIYIIERKKTPEVTSHRKFPEISDGNSIVVIINDEKEKSYESLNKIFNAVQMSIKDISLINIHKSTPDLSEIKFKILISFGVSPDILNLNLKETINEIKEIKNSMYLFANTFEEMEKDINKKKKFWSAFQSLFK
jgi:hypothetical protein